ncbi:hypothetical protein [Moraxella sp. VT-16-12]|uniref:hypothetical protein n=1 Tax=Moraxella sp. VT-16-12 TaxID=2014877 RepID=UPI000B7F830A|nr:hypothetical protein [Moraxella sp. VT-16-12]TWV83056.1 hypothetical protein CEW93_005165 [Moraxella sp. VT-16-12]
MFHRYTVFLVACALPLLFVRQIAPSMAHELDFWLLWLVAMTVVGLPILFAESALSARSGDGVWTGMQKLTREADAKLIWRIFAGLSVLVAILIASDMTAHIGAGVIQHLPQLDLSVPSFGLSMGLMVVVLILSVLKSRLLPVGLVLVLIGSLISLFDGGLGSEISVPAMTKIGFGEWAKAVSLALISVGVGTGLYWFGGGQSSRIIYENKKSLAGFILPIWLTQIVFGSFALLVSSAFVTPTSFLVSSLGVLLVAGFLVHYAMRELMGRFGLMMGAGTTVVGVLLLSAIPAKVVLMMLVMVSLVAVVVLSVFSGFGMKISHLRKTFNFKTEGRYNIWRILVRLVVPLAVVLAMMGWVIEWLK